MECLKCGSLRLAHRTRFAIQQVHGREMSDCGLIYRSEVRKPHGRALVEYRGKSTALPVLLAVGALQMQTTKGVGASCSKHRHHLVGFREFQVRNAEGARPNGARHPTVVEHGELQLAKRAAILIVNQTLRRWGCRKMNQIILPSRFPPPFEALLLWQLVAPESV